MKEDLKEGRERKKLTRCSRCGRDDTNSHSWEDGWPNYGRIELGFSSQAFAALCGAKGCAEEEHFAAWRKGHPAMVENQAQSVIFEWGNGYKFDSRDRYRLCRECQRSLLTVVGNFFGYGK